ncbi:putative bifunctional diguanylate cyclase/phosphodiesterase [Sporosarcina obsidiansis]|uniref:putative bifunctional diguanylate cyclase/phosphodiesterase n=1 Tax=Sporosarcina obsidiansis TaxID=2660748 RepID=UPI0018918C32|nr:diguanylate cyclase [Sporosarcina obsidiansis]
MINESDFFRLNTAFPPAVYHTLLKEMQQGAFIADDHKHLLFANTSFFRLTQNDNLDLPVVNFFRATELDYIWKEAEVIGYWKGNISLGIEGNNKYLRLFYYQDTVNHRAYYYGLLQNPLVSDRPIEKNEAFTDSLTEIGNRSYLNSRMDSLFSEDPERNKMHAVLFLDLDRFKQVNDMMGHFVGDELLKEFTRRLKKILRKNDLFARLGGDEFVIVQTNIKHEGEAVLLADRIFEQIELPHHFASYEIMMSTSIGISMYPENGTDRESLINKSDLAMYESKRKGRNRHTVFKQDLEQRILDLQQFEKELTDVIQSKKFDLLYEPKLHLETGLLCGAEVLFQCRECNQTSETLRGYHYKLEEMGLDIPITDLIIERICEDLCRTPEKIRSRIVIAVDISSSYFKHPLFIQNLCEILERFHMKPHNFELELEEQVIMVDIDQSISRLRKLKQLGFHLTIDHFGNGFSSIPLLSDPSITHLKLDQNLINRLSSEEDQWTIVKAIIGMAEILEIEVSVDGIDNERHFEQLRTLGCRDAQGKYISKPLNFDEFLQLFQ